MGCVGQVGADAYNARRCAVEAGIPISVPAFTVNRLCSSGLQAIWSGVQAIRAGDSRTVIAGGDENMTRLPFLDFSARDGMRLGNRTLEDGLLTALTDPFHGYLMGVTGEIVAERFGITRERQDALAFQSQQRAAAAIAAGAFAGQIVEVEGVHADEHPRPDTTLEKLATLKPAFKKDGTVTAGNAAGINDGAAAVVLESDEHASERGATPLAVVRSVAAAALESEIMGFGPALAIPKALAKAGITMDDLDVIEFNEAFAAQVLAVLDDIGVEQDDPRLNPEGGGIALGHPVGATGAILTIKAIDRLHRTGGRYALVTMCIGGGQGLAAVIERV